MTPHRIGARTRVATYTRLASAGPRGRNLRRREAFITQAVTRWPGAVLVARYADVGLAGRLPRPGLDRLLGDAAHGGFDVVVVDDLDRLDTEPARLRWLLDRCAACGVRVVPLVGVDRRRRAVGWVAVAVAELLGG